LLSVEIARAEWVLLNSKKIKTCLKEEVKKKERRKKERKEAVNSERNQTGTKIRVRGKIRNAGGQGGKKRGLRVGKKGVYIKKK